MSYNNQIFFIWFLQVTKKTRVFLVRHGQTQWNLQSRLQGHKNSPLTEKGKEQALKIKSTLSSLEIKKAYVSPLQRAQDTLEIILEGRDTSIIKCNMLKEINLGPWEGKTKDETKETHPKQYENFWNKPHLFSLEGAETYEQLQKRVVDKIKVIFAEAEEDNTILIVTHWIAIKVAHAYFSSIPLHDLSTLPDIENGDFLALQNDRGTISLT